MFDLTSRTALITGSGQGIGLAIAEGLAKAGARIILNGRSAGPLEAAAIRLRAAGADVLTSIFDVTDVGAVRDAIDRFEDSGVAIDVLSTMPVSRNAAPLRTSSPRTGAH